MYTSYTTVFFILCYIGVYIAAMVDTRRFKSSTGVNVSKAFSVRTIIHFTLLIVEAALAGRVV